MRFFTRMLAAVTVVFLTFCANNNLFAQCPISVSAGDDIYLCAPPTPTQLDGSISGDYLSFTWTPTAGLSGVNTLTPTVNVAATATYVLTAKAVDLSQNSILNGGFDSGNTDFTSAYTYSPGDLWPEGVYEVLTDPSASHPNFAACTDHSGGGAMMAVNGNGTANQEVWCQTVSVSPNTEYAFTAWVTSLVAASPARLQFSVNGVNLGSIFNVSSTLCNWQRFYAIWNSGGNTTATICIVNQNTALSGNDFAIDDIGFSPICQVRDTVRVNVINVNAVASPLNVSIPCEGALINLSGNGSSTGPGYTYQWSTPDGNIVSGANTLTPVVNAAGDYELTVSYNNNGVECTKSVTVNVFQGAPLTVNINTPQPLGCGSTTQTLTGNSTQPNVSYQWTTPDGNIVSGATSKNCVINEPGEYILTVTNLLTGCTATNSTVVVAATNVPVAVANTSNGISCLQNSATLSGSGSSTGAGISYLWTALIGGNIVGPANALTANVNGPGVYAFSVTNTSTNCSSVDTVTVAANNLPPTLSIAPADTFFCQVDTVFLTSSASPATLNYAWMSTAGGVFASGTTSAQAAVLTPGTYSLTATNPANGCTSTTSVTVVADNAPPLAVVATPDSITCQQNNVTLSGNGSSSGTNFSYAWTGPGLVSGAQTLSPVVNADGAYLLVVTNTSNACTDTAAVTVYADLAAITAVANVADTLDCLTNALILNSNGSSSGPGFTYAWSTTDGTISGSNTTPTPTVTAPGTYQLLLTNPANGCTSTDQVLVLQDIAPPAVSIATPDTLTCTQPSEALVATLLSSTGDFSYQWTSATGNITAGATTLSPTVNAAGVYDLVVTNAANGCSATFSTTVAQAAGLPVVVIQTPDTLTCAAPQLQIDASASSTGMGIQWTASNGGQIASGAQTLTPQVSTAGTYTLALINSANGCITTGSVEVAVNQTLPPAVAGPDSTLTCTTPQLTLTANAGTSGIYNYLWQTTGGTLVGSPNAATVGASAAGTYTVQVTDPANGCTRTDVLVLNANQTPPTVTPQTPGVLTCVTTSVNLALNNASPTFTYQWQTADGNLVSGAQTAAPTVDLAGTYTVQVVNPQNGCTATTNVQVTANTQPPVVQIALPDTLTCTTTQLVLDATSNGTQFVWTTPDGHIVGSNNVTDAPVDEPGTYDLVATLGSNGCTASAQVLVFENMAPPTVEAGLNDTLNCQNATLALNGTSSAGVTLQWTASTGTVLSGGNTLQPVVDHPATYTLTATQLSNGCTATDQVLIANDASAPVATIQTPATLTCLLTQTTLQGQGSQGNGISYNWVASNGGQIFSGGNTLQPVVTEPGVYTLTINDSNNGCTTTASVTVLENVLPPAVNAGLDAVVTCQTPTPALAGTGGTGITLAWTTSGGGQIVSGANTATPVVSAGGTYLLTATSSTNGCTATDQAVVTVDTLAPTVAIAAPATLTCTLQQTPLSGSVAQPAAGNYSLNWTATNGGSFVGATNNLTPTVDAPGTYRLRITNSQNGCTQVAQVVVNENVTPPVAVAAPAPAITCSQPQPSLSGTGSSAGNYVWSGPQVVSGGTSLTPVIGQPGPYTLQVTNPANGCTATASTTVITNQTPLVVNLTTASPLTCVQLSTALSASVQVTPGATYNFGWTTSNGHFVSGQTTLTPLVDDPGVYAILVTNNTNGCTTTATTTVTEDVTPPSANAGPDALLHCQQQIATLQGTVTAGLSYAWQVSNGGNIAQGATTGTPQVDAPGTYTLVVTKLSNGCTASDVAVVTEAPLPVLAYEVEQPDCHQPRGSIEAETASGTVPFQWSFDGGQSFSGNPLAGQLPPGTYTVVVKDAYGCTDEAEVLVTEPFFPSVQLPPSYRIELGDSVQLVPQSTPPPVAMSAWLWTSDNAAAPACATCGQPFVAPSNTAFYTVVATDLNGCTATARTRVEVDRRRHVYVPNVFTPDGDSDNNRFLVFARGVVEVELLSVYDRWGDLVWRGQHLTPNDTTQGWDGLIAGKSATPAVFVWVAVLVFPDGEKEVYSGDVTLLR